MLLDSLCKVDRGRSSLLTQLGALACLLAFSTQCLAYIPVPTPGQCKSLSGSQAKSKTVSMSLVYEHLGLLNKSISQSTSLPQLLRILEELGVRALVNAEPLEYLSVKRPEKDGQQEDAEETYEELPKYIHVTLKDKNALNPVQVASLVSWIAKNPGFTVLLYDDADLQRYIAKYFPEFSPVFDGLSSPVEKADAWRYLVLCQHGGIYTDVDVVCMHGVDTWVAHNETFPHLLVGLENAFKDEAAAKKWTYARRVQMSQWTMAARPGSALLCRMKNYIRARVVEEEQGHVGPLSPDQSVLERTGPGIWTDSLANYLRAQGLSMDEVLNGVRLQQVQILPQTAFGCSVLYWDIHNTQSLVYHVNWNSWKIQQSTFETNATVLKEGKRNAALDKDKAPAGEHRLPPSTNSDRADHDHKEATSQQQIRASSQPAPSGETGVPTYDSGVTPPPKELTPPHLEPLSSGEAPSEDPSQEASPLLDAPARFSTDASVQTPDLAKSETKSLPGVTLPVPLLSNRRSVIERVQGASQGETGSSGYSSYLRSSWTTGSFPLIVQSAAFLLATMAVMFYYGVPSVVMKVAREAAAASGSRIK